MEEKKNPLGFLDELLEEEKTSNEYFGHVDFWRHFEHIDVTHVYNAKSIEFRNLKLIVYELFFYAVWIIMVTLYISFNMGYDGMNLEARRQQEQYWGDCLLNRCAIDDVRDGKSFLHFMENIYLPKVFSDQEEYFPLTGVDDISGNMKPIYSLNDQSVPWIPRYAGDGKNIILLGNTRIRQIRVRKNALDCTIRKQFEFIAPYKEDELIACYAPFDQEKESTMAFDRRHTPSNVLKYFSHSLRTPVQSEDQYVSLTRRPFADMTEMQGLHGLYPGEGFYMDLPLKKTPDDPEALNNEDATTVLKELYTWTWIDQKTRAIVVENSVVNPNTNIIVSNRLLFEFNAYGTVNIIRDHFPMRASLLKLSLTATDEKEFFMFLVLFTSCFLLYFSSSCWFLYKNGIEYFFYAWNLIDCVIILLFWIYLGIRLNTFVVVMDETIFLPEMLGMPEFFFSFSKLKPGLVAAEGILSFIGVLSWIRFLKFFTLLDRFRLLVRTIERTFKDLVIFASLLFAIILGFSIAFHVGFYSNEKVPEFQTLTGSMFTLLFILAKGVKLHFLFESNDWLPQALFWAYLLIVYFLLVNMFMAIVQDTYTLVNFASSNKTKKQFSQDSVIWCFFISYMAKLKGEVFISDNDLDEDRGQLNEQFIEVAALPEIVQKAWGRKREQIRELVQSKLETMGNNVQIRQMASEFEDFDKKGVISRVQIQRLLHEDELLVQILGTDKAIDVIRRFTVPEYRDSAEDAFEEIMTLQENIFTKLEEFDTQKTGAQLEFGCIDSLKLVATGLHDALTEIQNQWRNELVFVLEQTNTLAQLLTDMTRKLETVQMNHTTIVHEAGIQQIVGQNTNPNQTDDKTRKSVAP